MACRLINSPITGQEIKSETWDKIFREVGDISLSDKLYAQLTSENFRIWFGDWINPEDSNSSQVKTQDGEPMLLFHSSTKKFSEFKEEFSKEVGFHFGSEIAAVERHFPGGINKLGIDVKDARADLKTEIDDFTVYPVFLNVRNMIEGVDYLDADPDYNDLNFSKEEYDTLYYKGRKSFRDELVKLVIAFYNKGTISREQVDAIFNKELKLKDALAADGYWYINRLENKGEKSYVVFDTNNIKSIYNNGQYSLTNNDIYYNLQPNEIDYRLKVINALQKTSRKKYPSGSIQGFYNDLIKQGTPKTQIDILKQYIITNNIQEIDTDDLMVGLLSEISYTIEVNITKKSRFNDSYGQRGESYFVHNGWTYEDAGEGAYEGKRYFKVNETDTNNVYVNPEDTVYITKEEYEETKKASNVEIIYDNDSSYSEMTVPGGTNYTNNEIATPQITPSIKGHAQFSTDNGIGWFRADDKMYDYTELDVEGLSASQIEDLINVGQIERNPASKKTRRILEVQSDLFQKERGKDNLITKEKLDDYHHSYAETLQEVEELEKNGWTKDGVSEDGFPTYSKLKSELELRKEKEKQEAPNKFLQLLNKDNNWVTFFVRSIIQDSAKKGYEKVLFPSGNTAAKVEGHQDIEQFIIDRKRKIEEVNKELEEIRDADSFTYNDIHASRIDQRFEDEVERPNDIYYIVGGDSVTEEKYNNFKNNALMKIGARKVQFQQELEQAQAGTLKISAIADFYESTIFNILKKQGYNPTRITDEYKNDWYEIDLSNISNRALDTILLNLKTQGKYSTIPQIALSDLSRNGYVNKYNPDDLSMEDRWYFNQSRGVENNQRLYHQYMSMNNLNRDMFIEGTTKSGLPYLVPNRNFDLKDTIEENNERIHKGKYEAIVDFFIDKFNIPKDKINYLTKSEFAEKFPEQFHNNAQSVYYNGKFYFFTNNLTADITAEELLHPFIYTVKELNKDLFNNLLKEAQKSYPKLHQKIQVLYKSQLQSIRDQELVTQALARVFNNVYENEEPRSFFDVIKDFVKWIANYLNEVFSKFGTGKYINIDVTDLHPLTSLEQMAQIINASDTRFDISFPEGSLYNMSTNPEDFNKVVSILLTDKRVEARVEEILVRLPQTLKEIKKRLTSTINKTEKQELQTVISQIEELTGEDKQDLLKSQIKGIITTAQLFNTLEEELNTIDRSDMDPSLKLAYYMSIQKTSDSFDAFKGLMIELNNELRTNLRRTVNPNIERFNLLLTTAISAKDNIDFSVKKLIKAPLLEKLVESNEHTYSIPLENINQQIRNLEREIAATQSQPAKDKLQDKVSILIKEKEAILRKAPTKENLQKVFESQFKDANQLSYIFESKIANGHPLVNTLQNMVNVIYDRAGSNMLNSKNEAQTQSDTFSKESGRNMRDMEKRFEGIGDDLVTIPTSIKFKKDTDDELDLDKDGNIQFNHIRQNALVQSIDNSYITQYMELEMIKDYWFKLHFKDIQNNIKDSDNTKNYKEAFTKFDTFKKENSQRQYTDEYYAFRAIMDEKIGEKTLRQITQDQYDEIDRLQDALGRADSTTRASIIEYIKLAKINLKKLKSQYNDDGSKKDEDGLKIAELLNKYSKLIYEYGDDILTPEGETKYKFDLEALEFKKDQYNPETYSKLISEIQQVVVSPEYFEALSNITEDINNISNLLAQAAQESEIAKYTDGNNNKAKKKDVYKEIRDIVKPYRDDDQIIDGITLSKQNPELVGRVKELQQYIEDIKFNSVKLTSLSPSEANEYNALRKNDDKTVEQQKRFQELSEKRAALKKFKADNTSLINELNSLFKELAEISTTINTDYYTSMINEQVSLLKNDDEVIESSLQFVGKKSRIDLDGTIYVKEDGRWYVKQKIGKKNKNVFLGNENIASETGHKEMVDLVIANLAKEKLKTTTWWKDNHYIQYIYNKKTGDFSPKERAIYIWEHQTPANPNFVEIKPAKEYYTYTVKDNYVNQDYTTLYKNIPIAKRGKFINEKYAKSVADPAKAKFLTYLTNKYLQIQSILPENTKMGHILPAIPKTSGENAVNVTNKALSFDSTFKEMFQTNVGVTDTDTSYLVGGGQTNTKTIPIRFVGKIDTAHQTKDALAAILLFEYHTSLYKALNDSLPVFEATKLLAGDVETLEKKNSIERLGFKDRVRKIFSPAKNEVERTQKKEVEKSVLSKSIDDVLDVFVYGQRMKSTIVNLGPIGKVDLAKVSSNVLGFAAKSIFIGNIISSINNSLSTRLQAIVNSGVKSNLYSLKNLKNAQAKSVKYGPNLLYDWTKLGNKSFIGQVLDHFSFLNENPTREITAKSEFTYLKNKVEFLTSPKQISEFEVLFIQFLTIADTITVKVNGKNEKLSDFEKIYEIKDGKFQMKSGVEFTNQQEDIFRAKFQSMARKLAGAYRQTEISHIETNWAGKGALFLRRYFVSMATNRFAGERWNSQEQEVQIGYQKETFNNLIKLFKEYSGNVTKLWNRMSDREKVSAYKTALEYGILITLIVLLNMAGGNDDKKELKKNSWFHNMTLVALLRARSEMEQFTLKGTDDLIRVGKNPFMIFTTIGNVWKIATLGGQTIIGDDNAYYKQNTGLHKKGDSKALATLLKILGYTGATFHPEEYYVNFKNAQNR